MSANEHPMLPEEQARAIRSFLTDMYPWLRDGDRISVSVHSDRRADTIDGLAWYPHPNPKLETASLVDGINDRDIRAYNVRVDVYARARRSPNECPSCNGTGAVPVPEFCGNCDGAGTDAAGGAL